MSARLAVLATLALASAAPLSAQSAPGADYIVTARQQVNLRTGPDTDYAVIATLQKGDVFLLSAELEGWYELELFSGRHGYVSKSMAARLTPDEILSGQGLALPPDRATERALFASVRLARARAIREAEELVPPDVDRVGHDAVRHWLENRLVLEAFHVYGVQPAVYVELVGEAERRGW